MKYYQFFASDQRVRNWLVSKVDSRGLPLPHDVKERYRKMVCGKCDKFSHDQIFDEGFEELKAFRGKGDFVRSAEGFLCVDDRFKEFYETKTYSGLRFKPLGRGWHVINVSSRVVLKEGAYEIDPAICDVCGRPKSVAGVITFLSQLDMTGEGGDFFTTIADRGGGSFVDRPLFVSEEVVLDLQGAAFKGGDFRRLLSAEEESVFEASLKSGKAKWPKDLNIFL